MGLFYEFNPTWNYKKINIFCIIINPHDLHIFLTDIVVYKLVPDERIIARAFKGPHIN